MSKKKATAISLPLSRTSKIMSSAVGVESVSQEMVALATKATEIFLTDFVRRAYDQASEDDDEFKSNVLEYNDLQELVHTDQRYEFLIDAMPRKYKFNEALRLHNEANRREQLRLEEQAKRQQEAEEAAKNEAANASNLDNGSYHHQPKESPSKSSASSNSSNIKNNQHHQHSSTTGKVAETTSIGSSTGPTTPDVYSDP